MRVQNFLAVSDQPLGFDRDALRQILLAYRIDGKPVLHPDRAGDMAKMEEVLGWGDTVGKGDPAGAPIEYGPSIRQRNNGKRMITDDNMGTEWKISK